MYMVTREGFLGLAGIKDGNYRPYTPVTIGRNNSIVKAKTGTFGTRMSQLEFIDSEGLRKLRPMTFQRKEVSYTDDWGKPRTMKGYRAIVGKNNESYAIVSDKYKMVQHRVMIDAMADAADDRGVRVFGRTFSNGGRFDGYAWFSNPDYHIFLEGERYDPMILGFRFYNSCLGDRVLGGEIVGIREVCMNVGVYGDILGGVSYRHFKGVGFVAQDISKILKTVFYRRERFCDRVQEMKGEVLNSDEQETVLWGLKLDPMTIERVMSNRKGLNPEIRNLGKVNVFQLYNATTAYISYRSGGDQQIQTNNELSSKISKIFSNNVTELIDRGRDAREAYYANEDVVIPGLVV